MAPDTLTSRLNTEVQRIFLALREAEGIVPKRPLWVGNGYPLSVVLMGDQQQWERTVAQASIKLGIDLNVNDKWEDAALRLRDLEGQEPTS